MSLVRKEEEKKGGEYQMNVELYLKKAVLQLSKGDFDKAVENLKLVIDLQEDDIVSKVQAHCILGEYCFVQQNYEEATLHLEWILERSDELEEEWDDPLDDEICRADVLWDLMKRFSLK